MVMKGHTNNPNGRPRGSTNKLTRPVREAITEFIEGNFEEVVREWHKLEGKDKLQFYRDLLPYVIHKTQPPAPQDNPEQMSLYDYVRMKRREEEAINKLTERIRQGE